MLFNTHLILDPFSSFAPPPSKNLLKKALICSLKDSKQSVDSGVRVHVRNSVLFFVQKLIFEYLNVIANTVQQPFGEIH